jgi:gephyrin
MSSTTTQLKAGILIVSDTASADSSTDKAGPVLKETFNTTGGEQWVVVETKIIPDNVLEIQRFIQRWTDGDDALNCIVTSGGTGFAVKDNTPEVCGCTLALGCAILLIKI